MWSQCRDHNMIKDISWYVNLCAWKFYIVTYILNSLYLKKNSVLWNTIQISIIIGLLFCHTHVYRRSRYNTYTLFSWGIACGILVPQPGIKQPMPSTVETQSFLKFLFIFGCTESLLPGELSLVAASRSLRRVGATLGLGALARIVGGFSCCRAQASVVMVHGLSCSMACGIFPDQGLKPCPLHWQANSYPLCPQGSSKQSLNH